MSFLFKCLKLSIVTWTVMSTILYIRPSNIRKNEICFKKYVHLHKKCAPILKGTVSRDLFTFFVFLPKYTEFRFRGDICMCTKLCGLFDTAESNLKKQFHEIFVTFFIIISFGPKIYRLKPFSVDV